MKLEFSKWLLIVSYAMALFVVGLTFVLFMMGYMVGELTPIVLAVFGEVTAINMSYMRKARAENKIKIASSLDPEVLANLGSVSHLFD